MGNTKGILMNQYKATPSGSNYPKERYSLYKKGFFFWKEIHTFYMYSDTKESVEEVARDIIKRLKGTCFEA
jgi:hypothetical protein